MPLTLETAEIIRQLSRNGLAAVSPQSAGPVMLKGWEALTSFEAWIGEQVEAAKAKAEAPPEVPLKAD